jgi:hypothetical protein
MYFGVDENQARSELDIQGLQDGGVGDEVDAVFGIGA